MPLTVNVGISRKSSANYQSAGVSINLTAELDQSLLADPPRLQSEIDRIYAQAEEALDRKAGAETESGPVTTMSTMSTVTANGESSGHALAAPRRVPPANGRNGLHASDTPNGSNRGHPTRPATESQVRALRSICKRARLDLDREAHEEFGLDSAEQLDVRQASQLIDLLKERQPVGNARGHR